MNNRVAVNWKVMLSNRRIGRWAVAGVSSSGGRAVDRSGRQPSDRMRLLAAIRAMFIESSSKRADPSSRRKPRDQAEQRPARLSGWPTTGRQGHAAADRSAAQRLRHSPRFAASDQRKNLSRQGYKLSQFTDAFARYLPEHPIIQSPPAASKRTSSKRAKRKGTRRK